MVLSYVQAKELLAAHREGREAASSSPDLGRTRAEARLEPEGARFPGERLVTWQEIETVLESRVSCFLVEPDGLRKIQFLSELTNSVYSLMPTQGAPTMLISGLPMHRIKDTDPHADTIEKVRTIVPMTGHVLDTATGLGYTAIEAARAADHVTTIELDPVALEVARLNPWSQALFDNPRITQRTGDSFEVVEELPAGQFARILHDPPMFRLAGDLYSGEFYRRLYRVLRPGGRLFHYIGDLDSKSGHVTTRGVVRRLQEAGFTRVSPRPAAFGVVAFK